jgi:hypothetical protein
MISTRLFAGIAAGVLAAGIVVGAAGTVLLGRSPDPGSNAHGTMGGSNSHGMMGSSNAHGMMGSSGSFDQMLDEMREHMGWAGEGGQ